MKSLKNIKIPGYIKNKYLITVVVFGIWVIFFDQNNLIDRIKSIQELNKMNRDIQYYRSKITSDSLKTYELLSNKENLEKFAREEYLMKKDNEEVFLVMEE